MLNEQDVTMAMNKRQELSQAQHYLSSLLLTYEQQIKVDIRDADKTLLHNGEAILSNLLKGNRIQKDTVHLAHQLYFYLGDYERILYVLEHYLQRKLSISELFWARWNYIDTLALLQRDQEAVAHQKQFIHWALQALPSKERLRTISDSTQGKCWFRLNLIDEWLGLYRLVFQSIRSTVHNRYDRFLCLRTACTMHTWSANNNRALEVANDIRSLIQEDTQWPLAPDIAIQASISEIAIYHHLNMRSDIRHTGAQALLQIDEQFTINNPFSEERHDELCIHLDNLAGTLFFAQHYDLSIPLHWRCIALRSTSAYVRLWLAAALWVTTSDRSTVLTLLEDGAKACRDGGFDYRELPEFVAVTNDPDFVATLQHHTGAA
jgi:hypothetical protein